MTAAHFALKSSVPGFLRSAARVLMSWPPLSPARKYVARAYERLFDWRYGIETAGTIEVEDLHTDSLNLAFGSEYQAAPPGMFRRAARMPARRTSALATTEASSSEPGRHFEEIQGRMT